MLNNLLLIKGYRICISKSKEQLIGVYIKGTEYHVEELFEIDNLIIEKFKTKYPNIEEEIANGKYFIAQYNYQTETFTTDIREKTYSGPYNEEITYNLIYNSTSSENLYLALKGLEKEILLSKKNPPKNLGMILSKKQTK